MAIENDQKRELPCLVVLRLSVPVEWCLPVAWYILLLRSLPLFAAAFRRSIDVELSKRIIALEPDFVHAVIRIGSLDFQKGTQ